jgi:hypothetical protein
MATKRSASLYLALSCTIEFRNVDLLILNKLDKGVHYFTGQIYDVCQVLVCRDSIEIRESHCNISASVC